MRRERQRGMGRSERVLLPVAMDVGERCLAPTGSSLPTELILPTENYEAEH